jgi:hypothetical protein
LGYQCKQLRGYRWWSHLVRFPLYCWWYLAHPY